MLPVSPLAAVAAVAADKVPGVLVAISQRLISETIPEHAATNVLMGLRCSIEQVEDMARRVSAVIWGIRGIDESSVWAFSPLETPRAWLRVLTSAAPGRAEGGLQETRRTEEKARMKAAAIDDSGDSTACRMNRKRRDLG